MTHHDHLDRDLTGWLAEDAGRQVPAGLLDAITAQSRTRRQQPTWLVAVRGESMGAVSFGRARAVRVALVAVLIVVAALTALLAAGMLPKRSDTSSPLAFIRDGDLYLAAGDGTGAHLALHQSGVQFRTVAWSPAGNRLALAGSAGVVVFDVGSGTTTLVEALDHAWSPDGRLLAVLVLDDGGRSVLRLLEADTLAIRTEYPHSTADPFPAGGLAWSPNNRWIAATGGGDRSNSVVRFDVASGEVIQIAPGSGHLQAPKQVTWSPDSQHVAYIRYEAGDPEVQPCRDNVECGVDVYVAGADGSNPVRVNKSLGQASSPMWSPDGTWVAFREVSPDSGIGTGLHVVRPDGTDERTVLAAPIAGYLWSPEGDRFLFARTDLSSPDPLWETSLLGEARPLGVSSDDALGRDSALSFDLQATGP